MNLEILKTIILFFSSIVIVPIFKRLGLGTVLGYLVAGVVIGPFGFKVFTEAQHVIHFAELGVVMFLFIIGLEMQPHKLKALKKDILGYGLLQVASALLILTLLSHYIFNFSYLIAFVASAGFVLSSTAIIMSSLAEKGLVNSPKGQRIFATLLFEDLSIVPLLAVLAILAPSQGSETNYTVNIIIGLIGVSILIFSGKWLLDPLFRLVGKSHIRELMTGTALFVVLSAALLMEVSGLSMAMGAFVAGVMLSESSFRHQLEADIEPFKGLLLGLFFMGVGMSLDFSVVYQNWTLLIGLVLCYVLGKGIIVFAISKLLNKDNKESLFRMFTMAHGGEFAFVLFNTALSEKIIDQQTSATLTAAVIISMVLNPLLGILYTKISLKQQETNNYQNDAIENILNKNTVETEEVEKSNILIIGFSRFSQMVAQLLLAREELNVTIIDKNVNMIQAASKFGFKVYYGDGSDPKSLHHCNIDTTKMVLVCTDDANRNVEIVKYIKEHYPLVKVMALAKDRFNAKDLVNNHVDYFIKESYESSLKFGEEVLRKLDVEEYQIAESIRLIREIDQERFNEELLGGESSELAKKYMDKYKKSLPEPYFEPKQETEAINNIAQTIINQVPNENQENNKGNENKLHSIKEIEESYLQK